MNAVIIGSRKSWILIAFLIILATVLCPVVASNPGPTPNNRALGVWEQDLSLSLEDGDTTHLLSGSQFLPPCTSDTNKVIQIFTVVMTDVDGTGLNSVKAVVINSGTFEEEVQLSPLSQTDGMSVLENAGTANLISYTSAVTTDEVLTLVQESKASVWKGNIEIPLGADAGEYTVTITGIDKNDNDSLLGTNSFAYVPVTCMEFDFSAINYGESPIGIETWVKGDDVFGTNDKPSVRNTGNCPARITFVQDDMGLGQDPEGSWNVQYGVRIGDNPSVLWFNPGKDTILSDPVEPGVIKPLDFSIQIHKGSGKYNGKMTLGFTGVDSVESVSVKNAQMAIPEFPAITGIIKLLIG